MKSKMNINTFIAEYVIITIFIVLFTTMGISVSNLLTDNNIANVLRRVSINGTYAIGVMFVILTGGTNLSAGAIIGVSDVLTAIIMVNNVNPIIASLISLVLYTLIGLATGLAISHIGIPPMVVAMGAMTSLCGVAYLITGGTPVFGFDSWYAVIDQGYVGAVPIPAIVLILSLAADIFFLSKAGRSRYTYGVGGNEEAARLFGINVHRIKTFVYTVNGFCSASAGLVILGCLNSGQPRANESHEMDVITIVMLGGISPTGGVGKISHVAFDILIVGVLTNGTTIMAVDDYWQRAVKRLVLLLVMGFNRFVQRRQ